jgi:hypothetical protein
LPSFQTIFKPLPQDLISKLEISYNKVKRSLVEGRFEPSELNGGKFSEAVFRALEWYTSSPHSFTPFTTPITNFGDSVRRFERLTTFDDSIRFFIPGLLDVLYDIRNRRGVGHLPGNIDPNYMDSILVASICDWILADLVRVFNNLSPKDAQALITDIVTKKVSVVWEVGDMRRVLDHKLSNKNKTLLLLYTSPAQSAKDTDLFKWVEYSNYGVYLTNVLNPLHDERMIEYATSGKVTLSPRGRQHVEKNLKLEITLD